ncbi:hypothetical protein GCM10022396_02080 [Flavivirga amylovorans]
MLITNCKNKGEEGKNNITGSIMNDYMTVIIKAKVIEDDKFQLYFSEKIIRQYHPDDIVEINIKGRDDCQNIVFNLPKGIHPIKIRLDVGVKKIETPIWIEEISFSNGAKHFSFKGAQLSKYFRPNKYLEQKTSSNTYERKAIEGVYDPFLISINVDNIVNNLFNESSNE